MRRRKLRLDADRLHARWLLLLLLLLLSIFLLAAVAPRVSAADAVSDLVANLSPAVAVIYAGDRDGRANGLGAGFFISADGLLATNLHVIGEGRAFEVRTADGQPCRVTHVHAWDRHLDLAVLRVQTDKPVPLLRLAVAQPLPAGADVVALGHPIGLRHSVVRGTVSGRREVDGHEMIQLAIAVEPGNSGGPLVDLDGSVYGIVTMKSASPV